MCWTTGARSMISAVRLPARSYNADDLKAFGMRPTDLSSLDVPTGFVVIVYRDDDFTGEKMTVSSGRTRLARDGWGHAAGSLVIECRPSRHAEE